MGDVLAAAGLLAATFAAAAAMVAETSQRRSVAMLVALALIPVLIVADQWHSAEITGLRHHAFRFAGLAVAALAAIAALTMLFRGRPLMLPLALIGAAPFRVPIHAGGQEANLLIPLYLVIAGGVLATVWEQWEEDRRDGTRGQQRANLLPKVLAAVIALYALQSIYSEDFSQALQNTAFFYVPFALAFVLLAERRWDRRLLIWSLAVVAVEALVFVLFGFWEYAARHLIWNDEVIRSNDFHTYFRVNSLFWDPNVYGRYLALSIIAIGAAVLWLREARLVLWLGALAVVLWLGLVATFSQSSFAALLVGLATLAALRWSLRWTLLACLGGAIVAAVFAVVAAGSLKIDLSTQQKLNKDTSGRANLVSEGFALFGDRPLWGYGSGSFSTAYQKHRSGGSGRLSVSHTEPVTVAAEQGVIGLTAYLALLGVAFTTLLHGFTGVMPGLRAPPSAASTTRGQAVDAAARAAVLACFAALIAHTMAYAGFLEDPLTWILLAIGGALAMVPEAAVEPGEVRHRREAIAASPARAAA